MSITSLPHRIAAKTRRALARSGAAEAWRQRQRRRILSQAFVASSEYHRLMTKYYDEAIDGLNSVELSTKNFSCAIDEVVGRHFAVDETEIAGDNSIFLLATR